MKAKLSPQMLAAIRRSPKGKLPPSLSPKSKGKTSHKSSHGVSKTKTGAVKGKSSPKGFARIANVDGGDGSFGGEQQL